MRRSFGLVACALAFVTVGAGELRAQASGTPVFQAPYRAFRVNEFGASLSFPENSEFGLEGFYTYGWGFHDIGFRGGFVQTEDIDLPGGGTVEGDTRVVLGGNFRTRVLSATEQFPLDGALTVGAGAQFGEGDDRFFIPVGVSLGRRLLLEGSRTSFVPYVHPVLVPTFGGDDSEVNFALGLGVDVRFSDRVDLRVNAGVGDIEGVGISLAIVR